MGEESKMKGSDVAVIGGIGLLAYLFLKNSSTTQDNTGTTPGGIGLNIGLGGGDTGLSGLGDIFNSLFGSLGGLLGGNTNTDNGKGILDSLSGALQNLSSKVDTIAKAGIVPDSGNDLLSTIKKAISEVPGLGGLPSLADIQAAIDKGLTQVTNDTNAALKGLTNSGLGFDTLKLPQIPSDWGNLIPQGVKDAATIPLPGWAHLLQAIGDVPGWTVGMPPVYIGWAIKNWFSPSDSEIRVLGADYYSPNYTNYDLPFTNQRLSGFPKSVNLNVTPVTPVQRGLSLLNPIDAFRIPMNVATVSVRQQNSNQAYKGLMGDFIKSYGG
jgi:hypothetical protein